jgi:hypothetical protein
MEMTNTKTAATEGRGLDRMNRRTRLELPRSPAVPADPHGPRHVPRPSTAPAYYLGRPAWVWLAAFRRGSSRTKAMARTAGKQSRSPSSGGSRQTTEELPK